eukprot:475394-Pleurochrysis_carterae.AAC.2
MLRGSLRLPAGSMQSSKCSVAREMGPTFELDRFLHSFPRFWSGGAECGTTTGRIQGALGYGVL